MRHLLSTGALAAALVVPAAANAVIVSATNSTIGVADESTILRTVTFASTGSINDLNITIDFNKCDGESYNAPGPCGAGGFSFNNEIFFTLTSPGGAVSVNLVTIGTYGGSSPGQFASTTFDDSGAAIVIGSAPATGVFAPVSPLSVFNGLDINGTWTLSIGDFVFLDALSFHSFTIVADITADIDTPAPDALALFGLGLAALGLRRRV